MSRRDKLLNRFLSSPKDFTFDEVVKLLNSFGFHEVKGGKTSGSAVRFESTANPDVRIRFHKPHPDKLMKAYVLDLIRAGLEECNLLTKETDRDERK